MTEPQASAPRVDSRLDPWYPRSMGKRGQQDPEQYRARRDAAAEQAIDTLLGAGKPKEKREAEPFAHRVLAVQAWLRRGSPD